MQFFFFEGFPKLILPIGEFFFHFSQRHFDEKKGSLRVTYTWCCHVCFHMDEVFYILFITKLITIFLYPCCLNHTTFLTEFLSSRLFVHFSSEDMSSTLLTLWSLSPSETNHVVGTDTKLNTPSMMKKIRNMFGLLSSDIITAFNIPKAP